MTWHVYMIECADGSIYTGIAVDVLARYAAHVLGRGAKYTRSRKPVRLLWHRECGNRSDASREEYRIKRLSAKDKRVLATGTGTLTGSF
jgi:putative endonuclease